MQRAACGLVRPGMAGMQARRLNGKLTGHSRCIQRMAAKAVASVNAMRIETLMSQLLLTALFALALSFLTVAASFA